MEKLVQNKYQQQDQQTGIQFGPPNNKPPNIPIGTIPPAGSIPLIDVNTGKEIQKNEIINDH